MNVIDEKTNEYMSSLYELKYDDDNPLEVELDWREKPILIYFKSGRYRLALDLQERDITDECFCFVNAGVLLKIESLYGHGTAYMIPIHPDELIFSMEDTTVKEILEPLASGKLVFNEFVNVSSLGFLNFITPVNECLKHFTNFGEKTSYNEMSTKYVLTGVSDQLLFKADILRIIALMDSYGMLKQKTELETEHQVQAIKDAISYIRENYAGKIYVHDLSELTKLNEQYFIRFFGNATGTSPLGYINRYRVRKAVELLGQSDHHIYEIAESCGFHNIGNFIKIFHASTGMTPHKYRKSLGLKD